MLDIDNPLSPEITLIVNGKEAKMSYNELRKLMLDCEWALTSIDNVKQTAKVMKYVELSPA